MRIDLILHGVLISGLPGPFGFIKSDWFARFSKAFLPAFVSTGILLGIAYILIMRAIRVDRADVEKWFETIRIRLGTGPIPVIEWAQPLMIGALYAIYGRTVSKRLATSSLLGLIFTSTVFGVVYLRYKNVPDTIRQEKIRLERVVDPVLYSYATDPQLRVEYERAQEEHFVPGGPNDGHFEHTYQGGVYDELRNREGAFEAHMFERVSVSADRVDLTPLLLFDGTYISRGFQWIDAAFLFVFNIGLDFCSVTIVIASLRRLRSQKADNSSVMPSRISFKSTGVSFLIAFGGTVACAVIAFISYRLFFRGDTGFFFQLLLVLPLSCLGGLTGIIFCFSFIQSLIGTEKTEDSWFLLLLGIVACAMSVTGFRYLLGFWAHSSLGLVNWRDAFSLPYVLAATTLLPATVSTAVFGGVVATKVIAEPARVVPEAYMTFVKEEVGGRQAAGLILLLGMFVGVVIGVIWPS